MATPAALVAQGDPTPVALSGTTAARGNYQYFVTPSINSAGQIAFSAALTGGTADYGIFLATAGTVLPVVLRGDPAPGGGTHLSLTNTPVLNATGKVAFYSEPVTAGGGSTSGVFAGVPGAAAARQDTAAPAGGTYKAFYNPVINSAGQVAFSAKLAYGASTQGIFVGAPGAVQPVVLQNTFAPGAGNGTFSDIIGSPTLNASGQVAFTSLVNRGTYTYGVFVGGQGNLQVAAKLGASAPAGGNYSGFRDSPVLNNAGQVAFQAFLSGGGSAEGVFVGAPGAVRVVALAGNPAPAGGNYTSFDTPVVNHSGQVAFSAGLDGGAGARGVFVGVSGSVQAAAVTGAAAPGGGAFNALEPPMLNAAGQVAFTATLTGAGVSTASDQGLYAGAEGALVKIVRTGDQVDVDPGPGFDLRTVARDGILFGNFTPYTAQGGGQSGGEDGRSTSLSDAGFVAYRLTFTDGTSGVFVSSLTPVPEPVSIVAAALMGLAALRFKRHGRRISS